MPVITAQDGFLFIDGKKIDGPGMTEIGSPDALWLLAGQDSIEPLKGTVTMFLQDQVPLKVDEDLRVKIVRMVGSETIVLQISTSDRMIQNVRLGDHVLALTHSQPLELELKVVRSGGNVRLKVKSKEQVIAEIPADSKLTPERIVFAPDVEGGGRLRGPQDLRVRLVRMTGIGVVNCPNTGESIVLHGKAPPNTLSNIEPQPVVLGAHVVWGKYKAFIPVRGFDRIRQDIPPFVQVGIRQATLQTAQVSNLIQNAIIPPPSPNASPTVP